MPVIAQLCVGLMCLTDQGCWAAHPSGEVAEDGCRHSFPDRLASFLADSWAAVHDDTRRRLCQDKVYGRGHQLAAQLPRASLQHM